MIEVSTGDSCFVLQDLEILLSVVYFLPYFGYIVQTELFNVHNFILLYIYHPTMSSKGGTADIEWKVYN